MNIQSSVFSLYFQLNSVNVEDMVESIFRVVKTNADDDKSDSDRDSGWRVARVDKPRRDSTESGRAIEVKANKEPPEVVKCHLGMLSHMYKAGVTYLYFVGRLHKPQLNPTVLNVCNCSRSNNSRR